MLEQDNLKLHSIVDIGNNIYFHAKKYHTAQRKFNPIKAIMQWAMKDDHTKVSLLHFIDVLPKLTNEAVVKHMSEYLPFSDKALPLTIRNFTLLARIVSATFPMVGSWLVGKLVRFSVAFMARNFFAGQTEEEALKTIKQLQELGITHTVDVLGEAVLNREEAEKYVQTYLSLLRNEKNRKNQPQLLKNISLKLTSLYPEFEPIDQDDTKEEVKKNLRRILDAAMEANVCVNIDMEQYAYKDITLDIFKDIIIEDKYKNYEQVGIVIQSYLQDSEADLRGLIRWSKENERTFTLRLVKGAYWEYETEIARKNRWKPPVFTEKHQTDGNFEKLASLLLNSGTKIKPAFATHNIRSIAYVIAKIEELKSMKKTVPEYEFQFLYGMGDEIKRALVEIAGTVRVYAPFGELLPGMAYFVRRLLENTSNESFLRSLDFTQRNISDFLIEGTASPATAKDQVSNPAFRIPDSEFRSPVPPIDISDSRVINDIQRKTNSISSEALSSDLPEKLIRRSAKSFSQNVGTDAKTISDWLLGIATSMIKQRHAVLAALILQTDDDVNTDSLQGRNSEVICSAELLGKYAQDILVLDETSSNQIISFPSEINEYVYIPKGPGVVVIEEPVSLNKFCEIMAAPLAAGNSFIVAYSPSMNPVIKVFNEIFEHAKIPKNIIQFTQYDRTTDSVWVESDEIKWIFFSGGNKQDEFRLRKMSARLLTGQASLKKFISEITPDFIKKFMLPKTITENRFRRGFAPLLQKEEIEKDFQNIPPIDFSRRENRKKMVEALDKVHKQIEIREKPYPIIIGNKEVIPNENQIITSINPAHISQVVGKVYKAGKSEAQTAVETAKHAFQNWKDTPVHERAAYLLSAAEIMKEQRFELSAWMVYEVGKNWPEAMADVDEAIDFLNYYACEAQRINKEMKNGSWRLKPQGVAVVISPWNFPLSILTGMTSASIVAGNTAIIKPASQSPVIAYKLMEIFREVGMPPGVANYLTGSGEEIGDYLVQHPDVDIIAFTGSKEVGINIYEKANAVERLAPKSVIAEMGGKNAIIIDESADLDQAIPGVIASAFGYSGQKCSACSQVIVVENIYEEFLKRLNGKVESMVIADSKNPGTFMGPLIDKRAQNKLNRYIEGAKREEIPILIERELSPEMLDEGFYVAPTVFTDVPQNSKLAQEELFGPALSIMKASNIDEAIDIANNTQYALTGGIYSRTPSHIKKIKEKFFVGNLYINRKITGAIVSQQPFGGFKLSGIGSKAGGPDYLKQFISTTGRC